MEDYESISHLVRSIRVEDQHLDIEFCSDCGELKQTVSVPRGEQHKQPTEKTGHLTGWFQAVLKRALGTSEVSPVLPISEKESGVCLAFEELRPRLLLSNGKWLRANKEQHPTDYFDEQLRANPIVQQYDVEVLVRVLLEVSRSDSELRTEERSFLAEVVQDENTIRRLSKAPNITVAELAETSSLPVKETILMLSWAMAYADGKLDCDEMKRLTQICQGFMLPQKRVRELQMASKLFLLDRHFQNLKELSSGADLRASFAEKARLWELDDQQLQTIRSWYPNELGPQNSD